MSTTSARHSAIPDFFDGYQAPAGYCDETLLPSGQLRPHWRAFAGLLDALGEEEFARRWRQSQRLLHENGIVYSAYGDPRDRPRPWQLDPLPLLISADQWQLLADAVSQRARLLNLILADLYGPQRILAEGLLPAEVVYGHPGFERPFHGQKPPGGRFLHFYATDLGRTPDGQWHVLADRTEAPSGAGFALENRIVTSRMLPDVFHSCRVQRLAPYFIALQETLRRLAPRPSDDPRVVLLSQGPASRNFFEDAYLARYLGYLLVEGEDLTVRGNHVMLKTLGGLLPVDGVLRRPNSEDCDLLELSPTATTGVAGLLQSARAGNVAVTNVLGSGLVESPVLMPFLEKLSAALLGEPLQLPGVATWWCGNQESLAEVLGRLDELMIRPAFRQRGRELEASRRLHEMSRDDLVQLLRAQGEAYVAQERIARSSMPAWCEYEKGVGSLLCEAPGGPFRQKAPDPFFTRTDASGPAAPALRPAHIALRTFAVVSDDCYQVMTGGLARVAPSVDPLFVSLQTGEGSKDVWVLSDEPVPPVTLLDRSGRTVKIRRAGTELPSRVADYIYWLGRRLERAEAAARLLRTVGLRVTDEVFSTSLAELPALLRVLAEQGQIEPGYVVEGIREQLPDFGSMLPAIVFDENQPFSLRSIVSRLFRAASVVRDRISTDCWRIVYRLDAQFQAPQLAQANLSEVLSRIDELIVDLSAFSGMAMESMTRTNLWRFLDLGRRLERALQTIAILRHALGDPHGVQPALLEALLEIADSLMTYRSRYLTNLQLGPLLDLLLADETNPRGVAYQLVAIVEHLGALPRQQAAKKGSGAFCAKHPEGRSGKSLLTPFSRADAERHEQPLAMAALQSVRMMDVVALAAAHESGEGEQLLQLLGDLQRRLPEISDAISHRYLVHAGPSYQFSEIRPGEAPAADSP